MVLKFHKVEFFKKIAFKIAEKILIELDFPDSSIKKVIDSYLFPKPW